MSATTEAPMFTVRNGTPYRHEWQTVLTVGQELAYGAVRYLSGGAVSVTGAGRSKVARVLKTKVVLEDGTEWKVNGERVGGGPYSEPELMTVEAMDRALAARDASRAAQWAMTAFQDRVKTIFGHAVTAEQKAELLALVEALAVKE